MVFSYSESIYKKIVNRISLDNKNNNNNYINDTTAETTVNPTTSYLNPMAITMMNLFNILLQHVILEMSKKKRHHDGTNYPWAALLLQSNLQYSMKYKYNLQYNIQ